MYCYRDSFEVELGLFNGCYPCEMLHFGVQSVWIGKGKAILENVLCDNGRILGSTLHIQGTEHVITQLF